MLSKILYKYLKNTKHSSSIGSYDANFLIIMYLITIIQSKDPMIMIYALFYTKKPVRTLTRPLIYKVDLYYYGRFQNRKMIFFYYARLIFIFKIMFYVLTNIILCFG